MKRIIAVLVFLGFYALASAQQLKVATYNLRYANKNDIGNLWEDRAPYVAGLIDFHEFDIFGTQEGLVEQLIDLDKLLPAYRRYGVGRDDGKTKGEHSAIFFKKDKFSLLDSGDFWLAENPAIPGKGWDATCCNRIVSWVKLKEKQSNREFYFFSAHYDHEGPIARRESSHLVLAKTKEIARGLPIIFVGDLNAIQTSEPYEILQKSGSLIDTYTLVNTPYRNNGSFNAFKTPNNTRIIDHIFVSPGFSVKKWGVLTDSYFGKYPSDHFPVVSVINFP